MVSAYVQNYKGYLCGALIFIISVQSHVDQCHFNKSILEKTVHAVEMMDGDTNKVLHDLKFLVIYLAKGCILSAANHFG